MVVLEGIPITMITRDALKNMLLWKNSHNFNYYGLDSKQVFLLGVKIMHKGVELVHCKQLKLRLDQLTLAITSIA